MAYIIKSDMSGDYVHDVLLETYHRWLSFALGLSSIGGRMLKHPSGRYASAITAERDSEGHVIGIYINESEEGAKEAYYIEHGHKEVNLKKIMLGRKSKISTEGFRYRRLTLRQAPSSPAGMIASYRGSPLTTRGVLRLNRPLGKIFASHYKHAPRSDVITMTDRPGSADWIIPEMPAYHPGFILQQSLPSGLRSLIQIP